jgi:hypothetical protein
LWTLDTISCSIPPSLSSRMHLAYSYVRALSMVVLLYCLVSLYRCQ